MPYVYLVQQFYQEKIEVKMSDLYYQQAKPLNIEYVTMDASLLLPPTVTPLTGIDFIKRLPCGDTERTQRVSAHY